jgi:hypothetical protein
MSVDIEANVLPHKDNMQKMWIHQGTDDGWATGKHHQCSNVIRIIDSSPNAGVHILCKNRDSITSELAEPNHTGGDGYAQFLRMINKSTYTVFGTEEMYLQ